MEFRLTEQYIRKRKRAGLFQTAAFALIAFVFISVAFVNALDAGIIALLVGGAFVTYSAVQGIKQYKLWSQRGPQIAISVHPDHLLSHGSGQEIKVPAQAIVELKLQKRGTQLRSILLCYQNGQVQKLEGYAHMDQLAQQLSRLVGTDKVKTARFLHQ